MLAHEQLHVYTKGLDFAAQALVFSTTWSKRHALVDHLSRAAESIVVNLAEAARQRGAPGRLQTLDYALGSTLECAACLDVAQIKDLFAEQQCHHEKRRLSEIVKMLIGLRKAWTDSLLKEEPPLPQDNFVSSNPANHFLFHHERLQVYQTALTFMRWFVARYSSQGLFHRLLREIDEAGTSVVLNIAEGNGRYAELDQHRFVQIADRSAVKASVYLDLCTRNGLFLDTDVASGKELLRKISLLASGF
jgi:four helix bundle protein